MNLPLVTKKAEPRVDSRLLAQHLGTAHQSTFELIKKYQNDLRELGLLRFETGKANGGRPERFALLNEDQCYLLLAHTRSKKAVKLKLNLVLAFREARRAAELHAEYLPTYHGLRDQLHTLAAGSPNERLVHINMNKLINKVAGIESGQRGRLDVPRKAMVIAAQHIATQAMQGAADHHEGYANAKTALAPLIPQKLIEETK